MKTTSLTVLTMLSLGLAASACSSDSTDPVSPVVDAAPPADSGPRDSGTAVDAANDANAPVDAAAPEDAATPADATTPSDAAAPADAGSDATVVADAATAIDAGTDATVLVPDAAVDAGPPAPPGATCANAPVIAPPVSATYTMSADYGNDFTSGSGCYFKTGNDRVFAVDVPAGKRLYASVRGVGTFDPSIAIVDGAATCAATGNACLAADDVGLATSLNFVTTTNTGSATARYNIVVDGSDTAGDYDFRALIGDPLAGDTCATAEAITLNNGAANLTAQTVELYANDYRTGTGCSGFGGGERVYRLEVPADTSIAVTLTPEATFDAALNVIDGAAGATPESACTGTISCSAAANAGGAGVAERLVYRNSAQTPKVVFFTVDSAISTTSPGTFSLAVEALPQTPGDTCATLPRVTFSGNTASFTNQSLLWALNDYGTGTSCVGTAGADRGYLLEIPAGKILTVQTTATGSTDAGASTLDLALNLQTEASCGTGTRTCLRGADSTGAVERLVYANGGTSAQSVVLFVETASTTVPAPGTYDITFALSDPPSGDTCASATTQVGPGTYPGQTLIDYQSDYGSGTGCVSASGPDRLYLVRVPNGERVTATVTPDPLDGGTNWNPSINFMEPTAGCVATNRVCITGKDSASTGAAETHFWTNNTGADKDIYVVVETATTTAPAVGVTRGFTLDLAVAPPPPPPPGELCSNAQVLTSGTPLTDQSLIGYANDYASVTSCSGGAGPDRVYKITVPAGERLTATVTPTIPDGGSTWDPSINLMSATQCAATTRTCLAGSDSGFSGQADSAAWTNTGSAPVDVFVVVETYSSTDPAAGATRSFTISATTAPVAPAPPEDVCTDTSTAYSTTTTLTGQSLATFANDYASANGFSCDFYSGPDRMIRVQIPAGKTLTATVTPDASWDPTIGIILGNAAVCTGSITCVDTADTGLSGDPETATYTNATSAAVDAFVLVESYTTGTSATYGYDLALTFTP